MKKALFALALIAPLTAWPGLAAPARPSSGTRPASLDDPLVIASQIRSATVYPGQAMVIRRGKAQGAGSYVFMGLPDTLLTDSVRVSGEGMEVMGVEVRDRWVAAVAQERIAAIEKTLIQLRRERQALVDHQDGLQEVANHYKALLQAESASEAPRDSGDSAPDPKAWRASAQFLSEQLLATRSDRREVEWQIEEQDKAIRELEVERGRGTSGKGHRVYDVYVELDAPGPGEVELEYLVLGAGWTPAYDLRASRKLDTVELTYRAEVVQETGEDWNNVELSLSTSQPEFCAQAPELFAAWLGLYDPERSRYKETTLSFGLARSAPPAASKAPMTGGPEESEKFFDASAFYASVQKSGAALRYGIARRETIPSQPGTSRVLVGRSDLKVKPEHYCAPALDTNIWLRGLTTNTSSWVMLPGRAAVYFGGDYVGLAQVDNVRLGEEFTLHLGIDPGLKVERIELEKKQSSSGFFGSRASQTSGWRLRFENVGAFGARSDGSVSVIVRESLPRSSDERLDIELDLVRPPLATAERWTQDREEKGFLTWELNVPRASGASIEWRSKMTYPEDLELSWN
jgi:uncharacterized protein (TIGR02231 family)